MVRKELVEIGNFLALLGQGGLMTMERERERELSVYHIPVVHPLAIFAAFHFAEPVEPGNATLYST